MTLRHLRIFVAVADCGKMSLAAEKLFISQPAVSQAIRELETRYDVPLFERLSLRLYLTDAGQILLPRARHILDAFDAAETDLMNSRKSPLLRLGASITVGSSLLPGLAARLEEGIPSLDLRVTVNNTRTIEQMILSGELDAGIVEGEVLSPELVRHPLCHDELVPAVGRSHPFYGKSVHLADLQHQALLARETGSADRNQFEHYLNMQGIEMIKKWTASNVAVLLEAATAGKGIVILSRRLIEKQLAGGSLFVLPLYEENGTPVHITRSFQRIYHRDKYLSPVMEAFLKISGDAIHD